MLHTEWIVPAGAGVPPAIFTTGSDSQVYAVIEAEFPDDGEAAPPRP
jgi:hypothetical protein